MYRRRPGVSMTGAALCRTSPLRPQTAWRRLRADLEEAGLVALQSYPLAEGVVRRSGEDALFARLVFSVLSPAEVFQAVLARRYALYDRKVVRDWKPGSQDYLSTVSLELAVADDAGRPCFLGAILETYRLGDGFRRVALFQVVDRRPPGN